MYNVEITNEDGVIIKSEIEDLRDLEAELVKVKNYSKVKVKNMSGEKKNDSSGE